MLVIFFKFVNFIHFFFIKHTLLWMSLMLSQSNILHTYDSLHLKKVIPTVGLLETL